MRREHYLSFAALVNEDTVVLLWYCTQHGLFAQPIDAHKK